MNANPQVTMIPLNQIDTSGFNCRGKINPVDCLELANSIKERGLLQPILVTPTPPGATRPYHLVAGFRRYTSFIINKETEIPAIIRENLTTDEALVINFEENLNRQDLNMVQEANAVVKLREHYTVGQIMDRLRKNQVWVKAREYVAYMPDAIKEDIINGYLNQSQIMKLAKMSQTEMFAAVKKLKDAKLRGESDKIIVTKKSTKEANKRVKRKPEEIEILQDHIVDVFGKGYVEKLPPQLILVIQVLGWVTGKLSDIEVHDKLADVAKELGKHYYLPEHLEDIYERVAS